MDIKDSLTELLLSKFSVGQVARVLKSRKDVPKEILGEYGIIRSMNIDNYPYSINIEIEGILYNNIPLGALDLRGAKK